MNSYKCRVEFDSNSQSVYEAITKPEGLSGWWTSDCDVSTEVGGINTFRFEGVVFNSMEIIELVPYKKVHWKCVEGWKEWLGTEVIYTLSENENGTDLLFEHKGLTPDLKCYKMCGQGWDTFIKKSLKDYVDLGQGQPHVPKSGLKGKLASTAFKVISR